MSSKKREKDQYAKMYPKISKWLNECIICHSIGYKPEMPESIYPGRLAENIRKQYSQLNVNEINVCEDCQRHMNK
jgi:hypothetical protein